MPLIAREFQIVPDLGGSFRVRVVDTSDNKVLFCSESYFSHVNAIMFAEREASLQADGGMVIDLSTKEERRNSRSWWKRWFT